MNLLFVVPYVPNPIRVRPYELLRTLAHRGHRITLATLYQSAQEQADLATLTKLGIDVHAYPLPKVRSMWNSALAVPTHKPLQAQYCWHPNLAQALQRLVQTHTFDAVHVEHLRGARYGLFVRDMLRSGTETPSTTGHTPNHRAMTPIIWDSVDCISHLFAQAAQHSRSLPGRLMTKFELPRTQRYERWLLHQFDQVLVTSTADQQAFLALADGCSPSSGTVPHVLPNGVDLSYFAMNSRCPLVKSDSGEPFAATESSVPTVVFSGKMSYHANVSAALYLVEEIMPYVWARYPTVKVQIVGKDPPSRIRALATSQVDNKDGNKGAGTHQVEVTGTVPEVRPYLQQATIAAAPLLYGAGIQNKILEAMACGTPVITTGQAATGIRAEAGKEFLVADDAETFAEAICTLLANPQLRDQVASAGRAYVERDHSWHAIAAQLESIYTLHSFTNENKTAPVTGVRHSHW